MSLKYWNLKNKSVLERTWEQPLAFNDVLLTPKVQISTWNNETKFFEVVYNLVLRNLCIIWPCYIPFPSMVGLSTVSTFLCISYRWQEQQSLSGEMVTFIHQGVSICFNIFPVFLHYVTY